MAERLLTVTDLAELLSVSKDTVYWLNKRGKGPKRVRVGREVRYRPADVEAWLKKNTVEPAA
ncbi:helix-turn-helix transcriptional regulator [Prauserella endophytica]|uniref:Helix-turn-helix domain-containing protein n=1 Tax=Prauserella endophytica TaxID=1592324 RepID=A0ABY2S074_9PSEU|nr:helix-turn-helix domain-containing protein [Prauserella endophytica]TKG67018.1 helix-turn-helix domain-containing protein [Prauserella endophytica]